MGMLMNQQTNQNEPALDKAKDAYQEDLGIAEGSTPEGAAEPAPPVPNPAEDEDTGIAPRD